MGRSGRSGRSGRPNGKVERKLSEFRSFFKSGCSTPIQPWLRHETVDTNSYSGANRKGNLVSRQLLKSANSYQIIYQIIVIDDQFLGSFIREDRVKVIEIPPFFQFSFSASTMFFSLNASFSCRDRLPGDEISRR
jgi:hypothetical protein